VSFKYAQRAAFAVFAVAVIAVLAFQLSPLYIGATAGPFLALALAIRPNLTTPKEAYPRAEAIEREQSPEQGDGRRGHDRDSQADRRC